MWLQDLRLREARGGWGAQGGICIRQRCRCIKATSPPGPGTPGSLCRHPSLQLGGQRGGAFPTSSKLAFQCHQAALSQVSSIFPAVDCSRACRNASCDLAVFSTQHSHKGLFCFPPLLLTQHLQCSIELWTSSILVISHFQACLHLSCLSVHHLEIL